MKHTAIRLSNTQEYTTLITQEQKEYAIRFHGHFCPGLAIGLRAADWALEHLGRAQDEDIVVITETDMCGVDAIQALVGCTFGKGNLIFHDYGKTAFSFYCRKSGRSARLVLNPSLSRKPDDERTRLQQKASAGELLPEEEKRLDELRRMQAEQMLSIPLEQLFLIGDVREPLPQRARIQGTLRCECCGEGVMESRIHFLDGKQVCIPCLEARKNPSGLKEEI